MVSDDAPHESVTARSRMASGGGNLASNEAPDERLEMVALHLRLEVVPRHRRQGAHDACRDLESEAVTDVSGEQTPARAATQYDRHEAIRTFERRLSHLEQRVADKEAQHSWRGISFDRAEISAIRLAIKELSG